MALMDKTGHFTHVNQVWLDYLGYSDEELRQRSNTDITHPDDREESARRLQELVNGECERYRLEKRYIGHDGQVLWGDLSVSGIRSAGGEIEEIMGVVLDITARKRNEVQMRIAQVVMDAASEGIMVTDADNHIIAVNPGYSRITGYSEVESLGCKPEDLLKSGKQDEDFYARMWAGINASGRWSGELLNRRRDGSLYHHGMTIDRVQDAHGVVSHYVATFNDISGRKFHERELEYQAQHDPLTGLPNRMLFYDRLQQAMAHTERSGDSMALLFVDLDGFKPINDELGHDAGDQVLRQMAERLRQSTRGEDTVARIGGDEFVLILSAMRSPQSGREVAGKVLESLAVPLSVQGQEVHLTGSAGLVYHHGESLNPDELIHLADQAMYRAKDQGRNCYCIHADGCYAASGESR